MPVGRFIICEQNSGWAVALRRMVLDDPWRIVETRSLAECDQRLAEAPAALVGVELTSVNADSVLEWLLRLQVDFPAAGAFVFARRGFEPYELLCRELGALDFTTSPRQLDRIARLARARAAAQPQFESSLTQQIMARLPWGE